MDTTKIDHLRVRAHLRLTPPMEGVLRQVTYTCAQLREGPAELGPGIISR
jgi:hypothetical protein